MPSWSQPVSDASERETMSLRELTASLHQNSTINPPIVHALKYHTGVLAERICEDYTLLNAFVLRFDALFQERWKNKTVAQRRNILLEAWPGMPKDHRPDTKERSIRNLKLGDDIIPDFIVWPFINLEDLTTPQTLPVFLSARGRMLPWEFASIELEFSPVLTILFDSCADKDLCSTLRIDFTEAVDPTVYGRLRGNAEVSLEKDQDSNDKYDMCARPAFQTLSMQQRILAFLLACARSILHDKINADLLEIPRQAPKTAVHPDLKTSRKPTSFTDVLKMAPYRGWSSVNLSQLRGYIEGTWNKHKNHIWAMRETPSYFADTVQEYLDHSRLRVPSTCGCHLISLEQDSMVMTGTIKNVLAESYRTVNAWSFLKDRLDEFERLMSEGATKQEQARPFLEMERMIKDTGTQLLEILCTSFRAAPECRNLFLKECSTDTYERVRQITTEQKELLDLFDAIRPGKKVEDDWHFNWLMLLSYSLEEVDLLLQRSTTAKRMLTGRLLDLLTDLSILTECARQITLWVKSPDVRTGKVDGCGCKLTFEGEGFDYYTWSEAFNQDFQPRLDLILPLKDKLRYPEHKKRSIQSVTTMYRSEERLDRFWAAIDAHFEKKTGVAQHRAIRDSLEDSHEMYRTALWVSRPTVTVPEQTHQPSFGLLHDESAQVTGIFDRSLVMNKVKSKTRGTTDSSRKTTESFLIEPENSHISKTAQTFMVQKRAYKTFRALYSSTSEEMGDAPKSLNWIEFVHAMGHIGFSIEKLQGSAWQFTPGANCGVTRGIHFHAPHPNNEITYVVAKRMGRRLGRVYGWHGATFQLA